MTLRSDSSFRPDIEGLRAVAVLLVVAAHCAIPWCAGGFVGVDVFFVLSGYLITGLLMAELRASGRINFANFYARRARRLLPACAVVLVATTVFGALSLAPQGFTAAVDAARSAALYVSNIYFDRNASDYFAPAVEVNPLLHTWSLGVEEQFYLLWPLLMLGASRLLSGAVRSTGLLAAVGALSLACCLYTTRVAPTFAFYELPARAWEFAAGGLLALLPAADRARAGAATLAIGFAGLATIVGAGVLLRGGSGFPGWLALAPVAGPLATRPAGGRDPRRGIGALLSSRPFQYVGARSYSWYLWHWPFVVFAAVLVPELGVGGRIVAALVALLAAMLTFRLIERPVRQNQYLGARPALSLRLAGAVTLLTLAASCGLGWYAQQRSDDETLRALSVAATDVADLSNDECVSQGLSSAVKLCTFGPAAAPRALVLFGDSHAIQWFNPFRTAAASQGWRLITVLKAGCPAADFDAHPASAALDACSAWRAGAIDRIAAFRPAAVVMASYTGATIRAFRDETALSTEELRAGTRRSLARFAAAGVPVVLLRDSPLPPFDVAACVTRRALRLLGAASSCDFDAKTARNQPAFDAERAAADGLPGIYFLDFGDLICPAGTCLATQSGQLVYRDDNHLAGRYAQSLAPAVQLRLFELLCDAPERR